MMMNQKMGLALRLLLGVSMIAAVVLGAPRLVLAESLVAGNLFADEPLIEQDLLLTGDDVVVDGTIDGDVLALGRTVTVYGDVKGSLVTAAETVRIVGNVDGSVYSAAVNMVMDPESSIGRSLYIASVNLITEAGSSIGRDLYAIGLGARLSGSVGRYTKAILGPVELFNLGYKLINQLITSKPWDRYLPEAAPEQPSSFVPSQLSARAVLQAMLKAGGWQLPVSSGAGSGLVWVVGPEQTPEPAQTSAQAEAVSLWFLRQLQSFISFLIVGGLALWLLPRYFKKSSNAARTRPFHAIGIGVVVLVTGFAGAIIAGILVAAIGALLAYVSLWGLAFTWWGLGSSLISVFLALFILLIVWGSKAIVSYLIGALILEKLAPKTERYPFLFLLFGLFIYVLLSAIPFVGFIIGLLATLAGLGAVWMAVREKRMPEVVPVQETGLEMPQGGE